MPDALPGRRKPDATWGGAWHAIGRAEYDGIIRNAGGLQALTVAAAATHPRGEDYVYTAWARKDQDYPLVASELEGCAPYAGKGLLDCRGTHTFWKFIPWPPYRCTGCGETARREPPQCGASSVWCEECGMFMREVPR